VLFTRSAAAIACAPSSPTPLLKRSSSVSVLFTQGTSPCYSRAVPQQLPVLLCSALSQLIVANVELCERAIHAQCRSNCLSCALYQRRAVRCDSAKMRISAKVELCARGIHAQCCSNCLCSALSQRIEAKVERGIHAQSLCQRLSCALSQFIRFEVERSHLAPRVQAVQLVQQPFAVARAMSRKLKLFQLQAMPRTSGQWTVRQLHEAERVDCG
jgi:hypothetical protein